MELSNLVGLVTRERGEVPIVFIDYLQLLACGVTADQQFIDERLAITACVKGLREISEPLWLSRHRTELDHSQVLRFREVGQAQPRHVRWFLRCRVRL